eukprot:CAMPEP_0171456780 /NCGR_PEP_ID=MMETSP0945-20130129/3122_1 /TAXON_ID=109269 /ORGANISM="Vaucheria litorea, Strain CCMP2940" /LENGTH=518 /DNA_ID=CAMNT_0011982257 /DNA_START=359 /DNA_END=1915 /DNA_ORIENTATION=+
MDDEIDLSQELKLLELKNEKSIEIERRKSSRETSNENIRISKQNSEIVSFSSETKGKKNNLVSMDLLHQNKNAHGAKINTKGFRSLHENMNEERRICPPDCICQGGKRLFNQKSKTYTEIKWEELTGLQQMNQGAMCKIYSAEYNGMKVAVKVPRTDCEDPEVAVHDLEVELEILWGLDHKYIIKLIGAGLRSFHPKRFIVLEFLELGTLADRLNLGLLPNQAETGYNKRMKGTKSYQRFHMVTMLQRASELAQALEYLHTKICRGECFVVHRDLKPDNVGFRSDGTLKLFDFGLARFIKRRTYINARYDMTGETGSMRYMPPEVVGSSPYNEKVDVYAFGLLLWEMLQYRRVFEGMSIGDFYVRVVNGGVRPPIDPTWSVPLKTLIEKCWHGDIDQRPDFTYIAAQLDEIYLQEKIEGGKMSISALNVMDQNRPKLVSNTNIKSARSQTSTFLMGGPSKTFAKSPKKKEGSKKQLTKSGGSSLISRMGKLFQKKKSNPLPTHVEHESTHSSKNEKKK